MAAAPDVERHESTSAKGKKSKKLSRQQKREKDKREATERYQREIEAEVAAINLLECPVWMFQVAISGQLTWRSDKNMINCDVHHAVLTVDRKTGRLNTSICFDEQKIPNPPPFGLWSYVLEACALQEAVTKSGPRPERFHFIDSLTLRPDDWFEVHLPELDITVHFLRQIQNVFTADESGKSVFDKFWISVIEANRRKNQLLGCPRFLQNTIDSSEFADKDESCIFKSIRVTATGLRSAETMAVFVDEAGKELVHGTTDKFAIRPPDSTFTCLPITRGSCVPVALTINDDEGQTFKPWFFFYPHQKTVRETFGPQVSDVVLEFTENLSASIDDHTLDPTDIIKEEISGANTFPFLKDLMSCALRTKERGLVANSDGTMKELDSSYTVEKPPAVPFYIHGPICAFNRDTIHCCSSEMAKPVPYKGTFCNFLKLDVTVRHRAPIVDETTQFSPELKRLSEKFHAKTPPTFPVKPL